MTAVCDKPTRRPRYRRAPVERPVALTPIKLRLLRRVAGLGIASLPQLAALACPSEQSARRHLRQLFDAGLVEVIAVPRAALAQPDAANDEALLHGSAPKVYTLARAGERLLADLGYEVSASPGRYGPRNHLFLAHELEIRDVRVWLELTARATPDHAVETWKDGAEAEIAIDRAKTLRPDAWFVYRLGERVLVGLMEADRGTERGDRRWRQKLEAYGALFASGRLRDVTGYVNARVLVIVPDARRRGRLADWIAREAPASLAERFWLAERAVLEVRSLAAPAWRRPHGKMLQPLAPEAK